MVTWVSLGLAFTWVLPEGHDKVIPRSQQGQISSKQVKIARFCCFFYDAVYRFTCEVIKIESHLDRNTDIYQEMPQKDLGVINGL